LKKSGEILKSLLIVGGETMRKLFSIMFWAVLLLIGSVQVTRAQHTKVYDLGHYPGGTSAWPNDINNADVVAGYGDAADGYVHAFGVSLHGPNAMQWFDLGTLPGGNTVGVQANGIADTGMIVVSAAMTGGGNHAFAWTPKSGMVDIGTLENIDYPGYYNSVALNINKSGTLIVGYSDNGEVALPVVWTPKVVRTPRGPITTWNIQVLETGGFSETCCWAAVGVNNFGQAVGVNNFPQIANPDAFVWNPVPGGKGWKITKLPLSADYSLATANAINDKGEIVGYVIPSDFSALRTALWQMASRSGNIWKLTVFPSPPDFPLAGAWGINDRGDIVGFACDDYVCSNASAVRWSTKDRDFVGILSFPGAGTPEGRGYAFAVNDSGMAVGFYDNHTLSPQGFASQVPH
jgi:probable HAF family extracellular repeat protein